jgi:hypothetical protein
MNIHEIETFTTVQRIYDLIGQENIMNTYCYPVVIGKRYVNPFRDDRNASCFYKWTNKGNLYFVDYATEQVYFSALDIAQLKTGYGFPDILYKIESDFHLNSLTMDELRSFRVDEKPPVEVTPSDIKTTVTYFKTSDFAYWGQFGITPETLDFYEVRRVDRAWINGKLWYIKNDIDPCYRYSEKGKTKLYRPLANKKNKFRSNFFGGILEGWSQLPPTGDDLIVTKGRKDVMTLYGCGVTAVSVRSENTPISENAFNLLKDRFKRIRLWYDNDNAGQIGCKKMAEMYGLECIIHSKDLPKDPSDIYKEMGKHTILDIIK